MKLYVIARSVHGEMYGGVITGNLKYTPPTTRELIPNSLNFEVYRKINHKNEVPHLDKFMTVNEFRKKTNGKLPVKFSQVILEQLGLDRVWLFKDNKL